MQQNVEFMRKTVALSNGSLEVFVAGEGPDVVCLHGGNGPQIGAVARRLAQRFRVWMPIVPGFEGTPFLDGVATFGNVAGLVADFIDRHLGQSCEVIGYSMGARIAAWLAIENPARVRQLVLMGPGGLAEAARL